ncbi:MAG TPA: nitroreductase/quinone reductase family protein [Ktedonobacteraceae bacterium]|nr:nitroreductase/quinone reductase family protein [Ktedonobacteraceae bacterium]
MSTNNSSNDWNKQIIKEFHANGGKVGGQFEGRDALLLHTIGAKSNQPRVSPLVFLQPSLRPSSPHTSPERSSYGSQQHAQDIQQ